MPTPTFRLCRAVPVGVLLVILCAAAARSVTPLTTVTVASGLTNPVFVTSPPNDSARLFIVEKVGRIKILKGGVVSAHPFLDISNLVTTTGLEQGFLGFAFPPNYSSSGYFYVDYTRTPDGATVIARGHATPNSDTADAAVENILIIAQPYANHNGGMLAFGPKDSLLYIGMGDGGSGGDPENRAQDPDSLLGKILRIDVRTAPGYTIPPGNPYANSAGPGRREIWARGVRNPWRFSFDRLTGNLWIADVGQNAWEEVDFQPATDKTLHNYGWRLKEGFACYNPPTGCDTLKGLTDPILSYPHVNGLCSITGGYVYRGCAIPDLQGAYFYGDYCTGEIVSIRYNGIAVSDSIYRTPELGAAIGNYDLSSFGEDAQGELYIVGYTSGKVCKVLPNGVPVQCGLTACCIGSTGNVDGSADQAVDISDLSRLVDYLYVTLQPLYCPAAANCDGSPDGLVDISDLCRLIDYLYINFPPLAPCR